MINISINADRLWSSIMEMAKIGATDRGGSRRLALDDNDKQGRDLFVQWCKEAGCSIFIDAVGNVFAHRPGDKPQSSSIMMGSHLDTQPTGGRFDGVLGVLSGLETFRTLNDYNLKTEKSLELVCWTNEEGSRYSPAMMGSGVFSGVFDLEEIRAKTDLDGLSFGDELERIGYSGSAIPRSRGIEAYFELHIEQGPILEEEKKTIGIVTDAQGQRWYEIEVIGQESHAGPTPMPRRRDALLTASKIVQEVNRIGNHYAPHACATVGHMQISPNSRNVVPGQVFLTVDLRHPNDNILRKMDSSLKNFCTNLAKLCQIEVKVHDFWYFPPTSFDEHCIQVIRNAAISCGYDQMDIVSGAGHDAVYIAKIAPTGMIFIPCENGISHNEIENATPTDCAAGCQILLHAVLAKAKLLD